MQCSKCKNTKDLRKNSVTSKGTVIYLCKSCNTKKHQEYAKTEIGKSNRRKANYKSLDKYRYKHNARVLVYKAVKRGELCKPNKCEKCFKKMELFGHHFDYLKPLDVIWLCRNCHVELHKKLK